MAKPNYVKSTEQFVNPYNFVSVAWSRVPRKNIEEETGDLSGVITCRIIAKSGIAVPDVETVKEDEREHKSYEFMRNKDGKCMIPGSSLRGSVRSVYETVTNSCLVTSDVDEIITRRVLPRNVGKPSLLIRKENGWYLYEARRVRVGINRNKLKAEYGYGCKVYVPRNAEKVNSLSKEKTSGTEEGYLYIGEKGPKKNYESVFVLEKSEPTPITDDMIEALKKTYDVYNDDKVNRNLDKSKGWYKGVKELLKKSDTYIPIWHNEGRLSLASIGRISYEKRMGEHLGKAKPCNNRAELCKACRLFGTAGADAKIGGRIRISDAIQSSDVTSKSITLKELASPKISYKEFYLTGGDYDDKNVVLNGRKYYWHNLDTNAPVAEEKNKRNATMEVVNKGTEFEFKVFFDGVTSKELDELKWTLTFGENEVDGNYCYKLGHGKPIGLGSAKIVIDNIITRHYNSDTMEYEVKKEDNIDVNCTTLDSTSQKEILVIANLRTTKDVKVTYPYIAKSGTTGTFRENDLASHQWFSHNKREASKSTELLQEWQSVEEAADKPFVAYKPVQGERNNRNSGYNRGKGGYNKKKRY